MCSVAIVNIDCGRTKCMQFGTLAEHMHTTDDRQYAPNDAWPASHGLCWWGFATISHSRPFQLKWIWAKYPLMGRIRADALWMTANITHGSTLFGWRAFCIESSNCCRQASDQIRSHFQFILFNRFTRLIWFRNAEHLCFPLLAARFYGCFQVECACVFWRVTRKMLGTCTAMS